MDEWTSKVVIELSTSEHKKDPLSIFAFLRQNTEGVFHVRCIDIFVYDIRNDERNKIKNECDSIFIHFSLFLKP
jgi:hypothetical protein